MATGIAKMNTDTVPPTPPKSATDGKYGWILKINTIVNFSVKLGVQMNHSLDLIQETNTKDPTMMFINKILTINIKVCSNI